MIRYHVPLHEGVLHMLCRLVPRKGAGPELRSGSGHEIDEYLMRLLRAGSAHAVEAPSHNDEVGAWLLFSVHKKLALQDNCYWQFLYLESLPGRISITTVVIVLKGMLSVPW